MKVNGVWFKTYLLDNTNSVLERISLQTEFGPSEASGPSEEASGETSMTVPVLPKYLQFTPNIDSNISITSDIDIHVTNVLRPFLRQTTFVFPNNMVPVNFSRKEMEEIFIIDHETLKEQPELQVYLENLITDNVYDVWNNRHKKIQQLRDEFFQLQKRVKNHLKKCVEFENIKSTKSLDYDETHVRLNLYINSDSDISEIFNSISTNYQIPYVKYNRFYKILHNFQICPSWLTYDLPDGIFMKIDSEIYEGSTDYITQLTEFGSQCEYNHDIQTIKSSRFFQRYTNAAIIKSKYNEKDCILITIDITVGAKQMSRDVLFSKLFKTIKCFTDKQIITIEERSSIGIFIYPSQHVLIPIWLDMCMTNSYFNSLVVVDESIRASKKRENIYMYVLSPSAQPPNEVDEPSDIIAMMMKKTTKPGMYNMGTENTPYIRVRIKAKTAKDAIRYGEIVAKMLTIYNDSFEGILNIYRSFIPGFLQNVTEKFLDTKPIDDFLRLKDIAPDIFLSNYSRECFKRPTIVSEEEAIRLMETREKQVIPFPIFGEAVKRYYVCNHDTHPYPGLRKNKLENKHKFPYVPCCYIKNQDREGTKLRHYYVQTGIREQQTAVQDIFLSSKILPPGMSGVLPENITQLFSMINPEPEYRFVRFGINNNNNSLLEAVMVSLNHSNLQFEEPEFRPQIVEKQRILLNSKADIYAVAAKQELYDQEIEDIAERLKREKLNALEFYHVMEQYFDCSIFVFTSNDKNPQGTLSIPPYSQIHVKSIPIRPVVFIYQMSKMNEIHCELIVQTKVGEPKILENMTTVFTFNDYIVQQIWKVFTNINRTFTSTGPITPVMLPYVKGLLHTKPGKSPILPVVSQYIDVYGKTRTINVKYKNELISFMCDPVAPYASPTSTNITRASVNSILQLVDLFKGTIIEQRFNENICREIVIIIPSLSVQDPRYLKHQNINLPVDGIKLVFLCDEKIYLKDVPKSTKPEYDTVFKYEKTPLILYDTNRKITKLLVNYALYMFSIFLHNRNTQPTDKLLAIWINNNTSVLPDMFDKAVKKYKSDIDNLDYIRFNKQTPFINTNNSLLLPSKEVQLRLAYMMRLYMNTNGDKLMSFYNNKSIQGFYSEISDFLSMPNQSIFEDVKAVNYMLESYKTDLYITKNLKIESREPYFIYISIYPDDIFIARNIITKQGVFKDQRGRPRIAKNDTTTEYTDQGFNEEDCDSLSIDDFEPKEESVVVKKSTYKKYKTTQFLEGYHPLQLAVYIVRFWNLYNYNPISIELLQAIQQNKLEQGNVDVYNWVDYQNLTNLTNYPDPISGFVAGYKIENVARYTAIMKV